MTSRLAKLLERGLDHWALRSEIRLRAGGLGSFFHPVISHPAVTVRAHSAPVLASHTPLGGGSETCLRGFFVVHFFLCGSFLNVLKFCILEKF